MPISPGILKNPTMHTQLRPLWYFWPEIKYYLFKFFLVSKNEVTHIYSSIFLSYIFVHPSTVLLHEYAYMHTHIHLYMCTCIHAYMPSVFSVCHLWRDQIIGDRLTYLQREIFIKITKNCDTKTQTVLNKNWEQPVARQNWFNSINIYYYISLLPSMCVCVWFFIIYSGNFHSNFII